MTLDDSDRAQHRQRPRLGRGRFGYPLPGRFQAALFDLDGLLIDSEPLWARAEEAVVAARGGGLTDDDRRATIGRSIDASLAIHAARLGLPPTAVDGLRLEVMARMRELVETSGTIRPGASELVTRLAASMPLGLASNSDHDLIAVALARIGLTGRFATVVSAADVGVAKPAPDIYLEACRRLGVEPPAAIGFEDSDAGIQALRGAGVAAVGVRADGPFSLDDADVAVDGLPEVLEWFDRA